MYSGGLGIWEMGSKVRKCREDTYSCFNKNVLFFSLLSIRLLNEILFEEKAKL
jgi:hypothetical protein